jgi:hypothetical protein
VLVVVALGMAASTAGACRHSMRGHLAVVQPMAVASASGPRQLAPGVYPVRLTVAGQKATFAIEPKAGDVVTMVVDDIPARSGTVTMTATLARQPFDLRYTAADSTNESQSSSYTTRCNFEVTVTECSTFFVGTDRETVICSPVSRTKVGTKVIATARIIRTIRVTVDLFDPDTGRQLGTVNAATSKDRTTQSETPCG